MMRIIGGLAAGRAIKAPPGYDVRPTPDRVKQAVFNSLGARVDSARVLELFAGSGALGLECLSRGAADVHAVELSPKHATLIKKNLSELDLPAERYHVRVQDAFIAIHQLAAEGRTFDLILADPPFGEKTKGKKSESMSQALADLPALRALLAPDGIFVLGHAARDQVQIPPPWDDRKAMRHGDSVMRFLRLRGYSCSAEPEPETLPDTATEPDQQPDAAV